MCKYVLPIYAAHWEKIGFFLNFKPWKLDVIKSDDTKQCCYDMFIIWLRGTDNVTWEKMFEAIDQATASANVTTMTTTTAVGTSKL